MYNVYIHLEEINLACEDTRIHEESNRRVHFRSIYLPTAYV